jgi:hypothetical protein
MVEFYRTSFFFSPAPCTTMGHAISNISAAVVASGADALAPMSFL